MHTARHLRCLRCIVVAGEVNIVLDEYSEVFSASQECRPEKEEQRVHGTRGYGFVLLSEEK